MRHGNLEISARTYFSTSCTRSTVTDYKVREIEILNVDTGKSLTKKDKVLWRTTMQGLTGANLDDKIEKIQVKNGIISIIFSDGDVIEVSEKDFAEPVIVTPVTKEAIYQQIAQEINRLKKTKKNLRIAVKTMFGEQKYRDAEVGQSGEVEFISDNTARVTLWEEIDYRAVGGDRMYATQKRLITYVVTPDDIKEESRETLGYE